MRPTTWMLMKLKAEAAPVVSVRSKKRSETAGAKSMRKFRSKGKFISLTLVDPEAVEILERLHAKHGSIRAAIEAALISAESRK